MAQISLDAHHAPTEKGFRIYCLIEERVVPRIAPRAGAVSDADDCPPATERKPLDISKRHNEKNRADGNRVKRQEARPVLRLKMRVINPASHPNNHPI
ncbi:MAG: hypothetical protein CRN43_08320 [Candidatus Nephrothrix sp. EaCA]|nr:MAG: hypothetical protein CRN43_08320 [Candidatus Nephrothrix sp. EaCA]